MLEQGASERNTVVAWRPEIFDLSYEKDEKRLEELLEQGNVVSVIDTYEDQVREYFQIMNPRFVYDEQYVERESEYLSRQEEEKGPFKKQGKWVYYKWLSALVHVLDEDAFYAVRTARNRNLITEKEQQAYSRCRVGIAGLSIGNSIALALALEGGANSIKIVDYDVLELSNLNRIRAGVQGLGLHKTTLAAREIYAINPYANIRIYSEGLNADNIESFLEDLDVVIDEIDDFPTKILIREYAKKMNKPVITAIDNSAGSVLEIERYDKNPQPELFHGRMGEITYEQSLRMDKIEIGKCIAKQVGFENIDDRMQQSFTQIGKELISWPQLGEAALLNGALVAYCVRKIAAGQMIQDRAVVSFDDMLSGESLSEKGREERTEKAKDLFG